MMDGKLKLLPHACIQLLQFQTTALCVDWYEYIVVISNALSIFFAIQTVDSKKKTWTVDARYALHNGKLN